MALTIDGSDPSGDLGDLLDAKLNLAGGKILQVVRATDTTLRTTTSTSFVDANISVTITPQKDTTNIMLIYLSAFGESTSSVFGVAQITTAANVAVSGAEALGKGTSQGSLDGPMTVIGFNLPGVTTAVTYKVRFRATSGTVSINNNINTGQLFAIEVSA